MPAYAPLVDLADGADANAWFLIGPKRGASSGWSAGNGDFDGDGLADLLVGAPVAEAGAGAAHLAFGARGARAGDLQLKDLDGTDGFALLGPEPGANVGTGAAAGDINGDGFDDLIVAAAFADPEGHVDAGEVHVVYGGPGPAPAAIELEAAGGLEMEGHSAEEGVGAAVACADVNGDGIDDLIIGAPGADVEDGHDPKTLHEGDPQGFTYVFFGRTEGWPDHLHGEDADAAVIGREQNGQSGAAVAAGDFDGDGAVDLIVGAPEANGAAGEAYVVFGGAGLAGEIEAAGLDGADGLTFAGFAPLSGGGNVIAAGDVNGDGRADAAFAASNDAAGSRTGAVHLAFGRGRGTAAIDLSAPDGVSSVRIDGLQAGARLGDAIAIGDVDGDGLGDLVIAAPGDGAPTRDGAGVVYVVFGQTGGWDAVIDLTGLDGENGYRILGQTADAAMGVSLAIADFDGDRLNDIAIGGYEGGTQTGQTAVVFGRLAVEAVHRGGTAGADTVHGGLGDDRVGGGDGRDLLIGHGGADRMIGGTGGDRLSGGRGDDVLLGEADGDRLRGGDGDDLIAGGRGADQLIGGEGADRFAYGDVRESRVDAQDVIEDLAAEDVIDLGGIDANGAEAGDGEFVLVGDFTGHAGEAVLARVGPDTELRLDTDGDGAADAVILLRGDQTGHTGFVL